MIKSVLIFLLVALITVSCDHNDIYQPKQVDYDNIAPFTSYEVPVKEGAVTIVTYGSDTLAITGIPMTIEVPKYALSNLTKATEKMNIQYSNDPKFEGYRDCGTAQSKFTLFFEDTRNGDDDYNDLILSVERKERYYGDPVQCKFEIFPIAMGAMKNFKLGFIEENTGKEYIVCDNCRQDLFGGKTGFINTLPEIAMETGFTKFETPTYTWARKGNWNNTKINWFIETDMERMYIALSDKTVNQENLQNFGNDKGKPFGIAMPWNSQNPYDIILKYGGPYYPTEYTPIQKLYENFDDWISGKWKQPLTAGGGKGIKNTDPVICYNISNPR